LQVQLEAQEHGAPQPLVLQAATPTKLSASHARSIEVGVSGLREMALDAIQSLSEQPGLDGILRHHLQFEPSCDQALSEHVESDEPAEGISVGLHKGKTNLRKTVDQPPMKFATQVINKR
jgi:hypothetical protein